MSDQPWRALWICDVNGVLVDSPRLLREAFAATARHAGFALADRDLQRVKGLWLVDAYRLLHTGGDPYALRQFHLAYVRERIGQVRPYPGVVATLGAARTAGVRLAATTTHGEITEAALVHTGLYPLFDALVTQEEVKHQKPSPESIVRILDLFNVDRRDARRHRVVYVGDTPLDIQAGRSAGVPTAGVTYGMADEVEIRAAAPDYVIHSFGEMPALLDDRVDEPADGRSAAPVAAEAFRF
jgi:phosphoglycolate phosphatase-like HAD superfamily hydrolase